MLISDVFQDFSICIPDKGILHLGANLCQEKDLYNTIGITDDNILWIEANTDIINSNQSNIINAVISDKDNEEIDFIITNNNKYSSIFDLYKNLEEHPEIIEVERRKVETITLNTLYENNNIPYDKYDFINLNLGGAELKALKGADKILPHIKTVYTKVLTTELYKYCGFLSELDLFFEYYGFKKIAIEMTENYLGDALYIKE